MADGGRPAIEVEPLMYELAKKARSGMKSKAERLAGEKDRKVDSSDWSPAEPLNADVKTGMRPVSRRAYKAGGKVDGCAAPMRADRKARKAGGRVEKNGEQPMVDRYVNRDLKKANEYRDGKKHVGGLKNGGRAKKADGGSMTMEEMIKKNPAPAKKAVPLPPRRPENLTPAAPNKIKPDMKKYLPGDVITGPPKEVRKDGGRAKKADGGPMVQDPRLGIVRPKVMEFGQNVVVPGLKNGGRAAKASGGSAEFKAAFRAARNAFLAGEGPKNFEFKGKSYSTELYKPTTGPATRGGTSNAPRKPVLQKNITVEFGAPKNAMPATDQMGNPNPGMKKGGRIAKQIGGALGRGMGGMGRPNMGRPNMGGGFRPPMPSPVMGGGMTRPSMPNKGPMQMGPGFPGGPPIGGGMQSPMMQDAARAIQAFQSAGYGAPVVDGKMQIPANAQVAEQTAMPFGPAMGENLQMPMARKSGGRVARAYGGETTTKSKGKSGKTNINIIIAAGGKKDPESMVPTVPPAPMGAQPVPVPAAPPAAPMGIPPMPAAPMMGAPAGPPAGPHMPPLPMPRKSGGRVSKVAHSFKDMTAGSGSGEGRLQKTDIAKRSAHKSGGKVYRSYKDMDAGAGSGEGRLEKTEIQKRKR